MVPMKRRELVAFHQLVKQLKPVALELREQE